MVVNVSQEFNSELIENHVKIEPTAPYSPHQNGTAERGWRTLFGMARSMLIEAELPKYLWTYAVMCAVYIRNRCYHQRTNQTHYYLLTGRKPNISKMNIFGTVCYPYVEGHKKKLAPRSKEGLFVGYDKDSAAYLVYYPDQRKVQRHGTVKFTGLFKKDINKTRNEHDVGDVRDDEIYARGEDEMHIRNGDELEIKNVVVGNEEDFKEVIKNDENKIENVEIQDDIAETDINGENPVDSSVVEIPTNTHVHRNRQRPKHLEDYICSIDFCCTLSNYVIPKTYTEAIQSEQSGKWKEAMDDELKSLIDNGTFAVVPLPENTKPVGGRWVYSVKNGPNDTEIFKARYVAKGYSQVYGKDYFDTFAPTAKMASVRSILQIAVQNNLIIHQMDVKTAYLNAPIDCNIYLEQPEGYVTDSSRIWKLHKSIYGLKQSGRNWNIVIHEFFTNNKYIRSSVDPCVYLKMNNSEQIIALIWVDDIILAANSIENLNRIKDSLKAKFKMKDLGKINNFLGIQINHKDDKIEMNQTKYLTILLEKFEMEESKPRCTPCELNPSAFRNDKVSDKVTESPRRYREIVGSLIYAMTCTRPDLCWVVTKLSQHLDNPDMADWVMVNHVLRYIKGTLDFKLTYSKSKDSLKLGGYSDSDWANSVSDRRSTTGFYFSLNPDGPPISWKTKKQPTVALSSCEAEYIALAATVQEALFLSMLLKDFTSQSCVTIQVDNQGTIALDKNPIVQNRSKHIDIRYHFIRDKVQSSFINLVYVPTDSNVADLMTKPFSKLRLCRFKKMLFGVQ